jgi:Uma2 family endonuclease
MRRKIAYMVPSQELIEAPLSREELGARYRALCEDPLYANVPGKIEIDVWGRLLMSPPSNYHGAIQSRLGQKLAALGGQVFMEASVVTTAGVFVADVAWASAEFMRRHNFETPFTSAPELCIEVVSPSNSVKELDEKRIAYLAAGAHEVWIVYPQSKRCQFHAAQGLLECSAYVIDWTGLFDG